MKIYFIIFFLLGASYSIGEYEEPESSFEASIPDETPINYLQTIGTHNSYHIAPYKGVATLIQSLNYPLPNHLTPEQFSYTADYTHRPLSDQLAIGIRHFELDVYDDPEGSKFGDFSIYPLLQEKKLLVPGQHHDPKNVLARAGFKVFHLPEVDFRSSCLAFKDCLTKIRLWSKENPLHVPIMVYIEAKQVGFPTFDAAGKAIQIEKFNRKTWDRLENEILAVFPRRVILTPDDVRGNHETLLKGIAQQGWPTLGASRGKVVFLLDNRGETLDNYVGKSLDMKGRLIFVSANPGHPGAGWIVKNDPSDVSIPALIEQGYMVRTRADKNTDQARNGDSRDQTAAFNSCAQFISTDYPEPNKRFSDYQVKFANGYIRVCNRGKFD